jgi:tetratricopeptide (TPR) repeat protein
MRMDDVYLRHAKYYAWRLAELGRAYRDREKSSQSLSEFAMDWAQIENGQLRAVESKTTSGRKYCSDYAKAAASLLSLRQSAMDRVRWLTNALEAARELTDTEAVAAHLGNLGIAYEDLGQFELSRDCLSQAILLDVRCEDVCPNNCTRDSSDSHT